MSFPSERSGGEQERGGEGGGEGGGDLKQLTAAATFEPEAFEDANSRQSSPKRSGGDYLEEEYSFDSDVEEPGRSEDAVGLLPQSNSA